MIYPGVTDIILLSDNGSALSCNENIQYIWSRNQVKWNRDIVIRSHVTFEAQAGKSIVDGHFAYVGLVIHRYARMEEPVRTPRDIYNALIYKGGLQNSGAKLLFMLEGAGEEDEASNVKAAGIRKMHHVDFYPHSAKGYEFSSFLSDPVEWGFKAQDVMKPRKFRVDAHTPPSALPAQHKPNPKKYNVNCNSERGLDHSILAAVENFWNEEHDASTALNALDLTLGPSGKSKAAKLENGFTFDRGWAKAGPQRSNPALPSAVLNDVETMLYEGQATGAKYSVTVACEILRAKYAEGNWLVRRQLCEANVRSAFRSLLNKAKAKSGAPTSRTSTAPIVQEQQQPLPTPVPPQPQPQPALIDEDANAEQDDPANDAVLSDSDQPQPAVIDEEANAEQDDPNNDAILSDSDLDDDDEEDDGEVDIDEQTFARLREQNKKRRLGR
jgi:hypothetical protein